jgi:hypothetical protein
VIQVRLLKARDVCTFLETGGDAAVHMFKFLVANMLEKRRKVLD